MAFCLAKPASGGKGRSMPEIGVAAALSLLLAFFSFSPLPSGGQISVDMLPILLLALLRGWLPALTAGLIYGSLHSLQEPITLHPIQVLLDYPLAYGALGMAGLPILARWPHAGVAAGLLARFCCHVISGVLFIGLFLPASQIGSVSPWKWSLTYNAGFMLLPALFMLLLVPPIKRALEACGYAQ